MTKELLSYLTFIEDAGKSRAGKSLGLYQCICGNKKIIVKNHVNSGATRSCGCYNIKIATESNTTHGLTYHPLYAVYHKIKDRCYNPKIKAYKDYGGRGIEMCEEWRVDFLTFYNWALKNGWQQGLEIDRYPNNDGNYDPLNCRITSALNNSNNRRTNVFIEYNGQRKTIADWARIYDLPYNILNSRINKFKWEIEKSLTTPIRIHKERKNKNIFKIKCLNNGMIYNSIRQAATELNIEYTGVHKVCKGIYKQINGYKFELIN